MRKSAKALCTILATGMLVLTLASCGSSESSTSSGAGEEETAEQTETVEEAADEEDQAKEEAKEEEKKEEEAPASKYAVTIDGVNVVEDYEGNPAAAIDFTFTNVSDEEAASMMVAVTVEVYQDGVQCDRAFVLDLDNDNEMSKVKAGVSVPVTIAYELKSTSDIEVEVKELFSWDGTVLASGTFSVE